jgi:hypothetical protein
MPGQIGKTSGPTGTVEKKRLFQASLRDWLRYRQTPALKRRAIFKMFLRDAAFSVVQKLRCDLIAAGADNDVEMDGGPVKDGDMDSRNQPALPPEKVNLCQYSGSVYVSPTESKQE